MDKKRYSGSVSSDLAGSFRAFVLEATEDELDEALQREGADPRELISQADRAIEAAFAKGRGGSIQEQRETSSLHKGLSTLLQLLRRERGLSDLELAGKARIDVEELRRIEFDINYTPNPRTVFQLEEYFGLPERTLVILSGAVSVQSPEFEDEVLRFAAHSKDIGKLNRQEKKLLNQFVRFLGRSVKKLNR